MGPLQVLESNAKKVFLRVRRKTAPTGPGKIGITDLNNQTSSNLSSETVMSYKAVSGVSHCPR